MGRLGDQEQTAKDENEVAPGIRIFPQSEGGGGKPEERGERKEQRDPEDEREREADPAGGCAAPRLKARDQDRNEYDIVNAEHDFERRQTQERRPSLEAGQKLPHRSHRKDRSSATRQALNAAGTRNSSLIVAFRA